MAGYTLEIHCREDGTYVCTKETDAEQAQEAEAGMVEASPQDVEQDAAGGQTLTDPGQVVAWVQSQLAGGKADPKKAWDAEASGRDQQGYRQPGGAPAMTM